MNGTVLNNSRVSRRGVTRNSNYVLIFPSNACSDLRRKIVLGSAVRPTPNSTILSARRDTLTTIATAGARSTKLKLTRAPEHVRREVQGIRIGRRYTRTFLHHVDARSLLRPCCGFTGGTIRLPPVPPDIVAPPARQGRG